MALDLHKLEHLIAAARLHLFQQALFTSIRVLEREGGADIEMISGG